MFSLKKKQNWTGGCQSKLTQTGCLGLLTSGYNNLNVVFSFCDMFPDVIDVPWHSRVGSTHTFSFVFDESVSESNSFLMFCFGYRGGLVVSHLFTIFMMTSNTSDCLS